MPTQKMRIFLTITFICVFSCLIYADKIDSAPVSSGSYETAHYKIIYDTNIAEVKKIADLLEFAYGHFNSAFAGLGFNLCSLEDKLTWICFTDMQDFADYALQADDMDLGWLTSYYSAKTNAVTIIKPFNIQSWNTDEKSAAHLAALDGYIMPFSENSNDGLIKIMHEAAHQLAFNTGVQKRKIMYPLWVSEGLACAFESNICGSNLRTRRLCEMSRDKRLICLDDFIQITSLPPNAELRKNIYAQASGLFQFLFEYHKENLKSYLANISNVKPGWRSKQKMKDEFVKAFGPMEQMNVLWFNYLQQSSNQSD